MKWLQQILDWFSLIQCQQCRGFKGFKDMHGSLRCEACYQRNIAYLQAQKDAGHIYPVDKNFMNPKAVNGFEKAMLRMYGDKDYVG